MTKFSDQLFDDLIAEHGAALAHATRPAAKTHPARRPALLMAGAGGLAVAATAGVLAAGGGTAAYAVTPHANGTVTLSVYQESGVAQANARLRQLGEADVVIVPTGSGCPSLSSLPNPSGSGQVSGHIAMQTSMSKDGGSLTVDAHGIPAGDILVVAAQTSNGVSLTGGRLTTAPAPTCVSLPAAPPPGGTVSGSSGGTGQGTNSNG